MLKQIMKNPNTTSTKLYLHHLILSKIYNEFDIETSEFIKVSFNDNYFHFVYLEDMNHILAHVYNDNVGEIKIAKCRMMLCRVMISLHLLLTIFCHIFVLNVVEFIEKSKIIFTLK